MTGGKGKSEKNLVHADLTPAGISRGDDMPKADGDLSIAGF